MPNPPGRRRSNPQAAPSSAEVQQLKTELADLKSAYLRDVTLISEDIHALNAQISTEAAPNP